MTPQAFRDNISFLLQDEMDMLDYPLIADCINGSWEPFPDPALDKAMSEAYASYQVTLRKLSRLATRLDYLAKETKNK